MNVFRVNQPGIFTTIQDLGRFGCESQGVPVSGAMDEFAFQVANILVGNNENTPALEITLLGPTLEVLEDTIVAVTGAKMTPLVNGMKCDCWSSFPLRKGDILSFDYPSSGARAYLSIAGGFLGEFALGSYSTYTRGKIGGIHGRRLEKGDILSCGLPLQFPKTQIVPNELIPVYLSEEEIRVVLGPQHDYFSHGAIERFLTSVFTITKDSDRMGYKLDGPEIRATEEHDIITDGLVPGAIQVPSNGQPIIMMKDAQTTGGYAKIAVTITADLSKLAQLKPGDRVRFKSVDIKEAYRALKDQERVLKEIYLHLKPIKFYNLKINGRSFEVSISQL